MEDAYYFECEVREGERGFADDDTYISPNFATYRECLQELYKFNPLHRWRHLRCIKSKAIYKNGSLLQEF